MRLTRTILIALIIGWIVASLHAGDPSGSPQPPTATIPSTPGPPPSQPAQPPKPSAMPADLPDGPQGLLQRAILTLERCRSVKANTRQRIELFGREVVGSGTYLEQRSEEGLQLRLDLKYPLGDQTAVFFQLCTGRHLWTYEKGLGAPVVSRIDMARVAQVLEEKGALPQPGKIGSWLGLGGLPKLLRSMNGVFEFTSAEETVLTGNFAAVRLRGGWKRDWLVRMLPDQAAAINEGQPANLAKLPPHVPHSVLLFLGKDDLFPYRIEYHRQTTRPKERVETDSEIVRMELFEVVINAPIPAERFRYDPGKLDYAENTERFLESLGVKK